MGKAITLTLARAGANVIVNYHSSSSAATETVAEAQALNVEALAVQADVSDYEDVRELVQVAEENVGDIDILVNSASVWRRTPVPMENLEAWHHVTSVLIDGPMYCANGVVPGMLNRGEGSVVNIVDLSAWQPWPGYAAHTVGKAALLALTRQLALDLAPGVAVNAVAPGPILPPPAFSEAEIAKTARQTLKERWGSVSDVTDAVRFLIEADFITGEVIVVDGGKRYGHSKATQA